MRLFPELTNCLKVNSGAPAPLLRSLPHSHTFPLSTQHPILSKDEEKGMKQMLLIQIKTANLLSFLLLILDVFHKPTAGHCVFVPLLSVFKQADDYKDDGDDDGNDDSGLRRSSCRVERAADNRPVYSRKGTLRMFKMAAAGRRPT